MTLKKLFRKIYVRAIVGWRLLKGMVNTKINGVQLTEKGLALAEYCSKIIMTNGTYQPTTYAEQMLEEFLQERYTDMDRLSAAGNLFITLAPSLPEGWTGQLEGEEEK